MSGPGPLLAGSAAPASESKMASMMSLPVKLPPAMLENSTAVALSCSTWTCRSPRHVWRSSSMRTSTSVMLPPDGTLNVAVATPESHAARTTVLDARRGSIDGVAVALPSVEVTSIAIGLVARTRPAREPRARRR